LLPTHESWLPNEHSLYRPRHAPKQRTALVCAAVFFLAPTLAFILGVRPQAFENHALAPFPSLSEGWGFFTGMPAWATDHMPLRELAIRAGDVISTEVFGDPPVSGSGDSTPSGPLPGSPSGPRPAPTAGYPNVITGTDGWLYLGLDVSNKCQPVMDLDQVVAALRRLREVVESSGRRFVLIVAPDKSTAVPEHLPDRYVGKDCSRALSNRFWERANSELDVVDLRPELTRIAGRLGRPLYHPNDSHWTYEGGVAMTYALADRLRGQITSSWVVTPGKDEPWPADIPLLQHRSEQRMLRTYHLAPDGRTDRTRYAASDFRTPQRLVQPRDAARVGTITEPAGLIADSFTQFASPFLAAAFRDLSIVHPETVAGDPDRFARELLVDRDIVAVELAERNVAGGTSPLLQSSVIDTIGDVLAQHRR
jgi:alginate O-acetyltransferase complex protein AlgJ